VNNAVLPRTIVRNRCLFACPLSARAIGKTVVDRDRSQPTDQAG